MGIFGDSWKKIQDFRNANIERREHVAKAKRIIKGSEKGLLPEQLDTEAKALHEKYKHLGMTYADALEYVKSERNAKARKEALGKI